MPSSEIILSLLVLALGIRTLSWHLQSWQLREYRFDRMRAWLNTKDGKNYFVPWFFKGLLPRPKRSGRIILVCLIILILGSPIIIFSQLLSFNCGLICGINGTTTPNACYSTCQLQWFNQDWIWLLSLLIWERTLWLQTIVAIWLSKFPVWLQRRRLFEQAHHLTAAAPKTVAKIAITGSYGKSSTKEILTHLLQSEFGKEAVLYNPANQNNEVAIARLIKNNAKFFSPKNKRQRFFVVEAGAYRTGEIAQVCCFAKPCYGILTGLNQQHVALFGSFENIKNTKFELAEATGKTVFFNADNPHLQQIFADRKITATPIPISFKAAQNLKSFPDRSTFRAYGQNFTLPWPGEFFVHNALLALECARELGISPENLTKHLASLPPLARALSLSQHSQDFTVLRDTYSANPDGVLGAIKHLKHFKGRKIFVSIPLRELGGHAPTIHQQIFDKLKAVEAEVWWEKTDFVELGQKTLGLNFHQLNDEFPDFKKCIKTLKKDDVVLLESKLSQKTLDLFK